MAAIRSQLIPCAKKPSLRIPPAKIIFPSQSLPGNPCLLNRTFREGMNLEIGPPLWSGSAYDEADEDDAVPKRNYLLERFADIFFLM